MERPRIPGPAAQIDLIVINGGTDEFFQGTHADLIALEEIDRPPCAAFEARVEELVRIPEVGPLPFLDYLPVGLEDALTDAGNVLPRQSVSPAVSWSIRSDGFIGSGATREFAT